MDTNSRTTANNNAANKIIYSAPASPAAVTVPTASAASNEGIHHHATANSSSPVSGVPPSSNMFSGSSNAASVTAASSSLSTPKKHFLDAIMLQTIREKLKTPGGACELHSLQLECSAEPVNVIKDRYLISTQPSQISAAAAAKTPASYRHLIDLTSSNLKCTDVFTEQQFLCKIINEPLHKVQRAYFKLQRDEEGCNSSIYGHPLVRGVHDIVSLSKTRTYVIIEAPPLQAQPPSTPALDSEYMDEEDQEEEEEAEEEECYGVYEDLHTYIRNKRRLCETEARALFHQICQTVQVCHRHGIILRDLKLKRFYFIDEARTKLQYESLEGSMILDNTDDDTLSDKIGCPLYTAPELLCPNPTYKGKPADMWSLGVILYTMLVGQYPFYEKGNCNLITIIRHCHVQIPSSLSKSVRWLLLALLRKNYEERMIAEHIFYSPWLKEQRPYYMYIPADVVLTDDIDCGGDDDYFMATLAMGTMAMSSPSYADAPLNYTRSALQMESDDDDDDEDDVEMG